MKIHKEGYVSIAIAAIVFAVISSLAYKFLGVEYPLLATAIFVVMLLLVLFIISFFRIPVRSHTVHESQVVSPADGKVVVIEEVTDEEYFKDRRIQISVFMSPANVHVNRNPVDGEVLYSKYHKGKYLVAWHPKSSTDNERHSVVVQNENGTLLVKQIAGALAKRIINYLKVGESVKQGEEMGFIKFGSRVDVLLPLNANIKVQLNQTVKGGVTVLAEW